MTGVIGVHQGLFGRVTLFQTNQPVHLHAHPHVHALIKVDGKDGAYEVDGTLCPITDDEMVLINPWVPHANWRDINDPPITILALYLEAGWLARGGGFVARRPFNCRSATVDAHMRTLVAKIAATIADATMPAGEEKLEADILELLQRVLSASSAADLTPLRARAVDHRIRKAASLMRAEPAKPQDLDSLAQSVGLSRSRFFAQFSAGMGMTPGVYNDTLRVEYAIEQLIGTNRPASDISLDLGFSTPGHFSRFFKNRIGFGPREYRRVANLAPSDG
ncbi:helix-turn-helix domain-containing protein [Phreatobacter sp. AB_2022a]|uniref:helix-turn-helix domain-containing protein n=1 Tax=Phreatobacter sp. AB_2022a TaxID=3003134 RepID=UPI0022877066|nr:AraC family transcriptional regulator [Phreatobacter sp. AB_2022a]MCZ0733881.1 AraC family transcriptional regulator [Phreatobacter sp. AB_2022a]